MATVIEQCLDTAQVFDGSNLGTIRDEAEFLRLQSMDLLPVESQIQTTIHHRMEKLRVQFEQESFSMKMGVKMIPLDVLKWRKPSGLFWIRDIMVPSLALVSVGSAPTVSFSANRWDGATSRPYYSKPISELYSDLRSALKAKSESRRSDMTLSFTYSGAIPEKTRTIIREAKVAGAYDDILLLCDATPWVLREVPEPRPVDPIVVGYKHEALWMLDVFNPTPIEQYVSSEFALQLNAGEPVA